MHFPSRRFSLLAGFSSPIQPTLRAQGFQPSRAVRGRRGRTKEGRGKRKGKQERGLSSLPKFGLLSALDQQALERLRFSQGRRRWPVLPACWQEDEVPMPSAKKRRAGGSRKNRRRRGAVEQKQKSKLLLFFLGSLLALLCLPPKTFRGIEFRLPARS